MAAVNALNSLLRGASIDDHDEALQLANAAIQAARAATDRDQLATAQHAKIVALLKLDRFDDALRTLADAGDALTDRCVLERAYALYKTGDLAAAEALAGEAKTETETETKTPASSAERALQHVAAQAAYRAEGFARAAALYAALPPAPDETLDLRINALAAAAQQAWQGRPALSFDLAAREDLEAFETAYNAGSAALAVGDAARAAVLLRRAQQLCEASEDLADDDKLAELAPILVQQAYALAQLGRSNEAAALLRTPAVADALEGASRTVAQANAVALGPDKNPYKTQSQLAAVTPAPAAGSDRLFAHQARVLRRNQLAVELQCFKFKGMQARAAAQKQPDLSPEAVDLGVLYAAAKAEMQTGREALRRLQPLLTTTRPDDVGLLLTVLQLLLNPTPSTSAGADAGAAEKTSAAPNPAAAVGLLEAFLARAAPDVRFAPGLVALAVALYRRQGRPLAVRAELSRAVSHWQSSSSSTAPPSLLRAAGVELLRSPNPADQTAAAAAFEQLHAADPQDRVAVAGLVAATVSPAASPMAASLTPVDQLVEGIDVASLLQAGVAAPATTVMTAIAGKKRTRTAVTEEATQPAKKTKTGSAAAAAPTLSRQARKLQTKNADIFDPAKKLDAERWLPLRDRSSYRPPKGKKGGRRRGGAEAATMQGGLVREEETLALAGGAGSVKVEKAPPGGGGGAAKKRKKGKK